MKFQSTPEQQAVRAKLTEYFEKQLDGAELSWLLIEHDTGIKMDTGGRNMVRDVLDKLRGKGSSRESVRGEGVILSSPSNAMKIVDECGRRVGNAIKGWGRAVENVHQRFADRMNSDDRRRLSERMGFVGALRGYAMGCLKPSPQMKKPDDTV